MRIHNPTITGSLALSGSSLTIDTTGTLSGSSTSTASFGLFIGDGSGLTKVFEGTAASSSISTRLTSFIDGTATLVSGSATSTGSFGKLAVGTATIQIPNNGIFPLTQERSILGEFLPRTECGDPDKITALYELKLISGLLNGKISQ